MTSQADLDAIDHAVRPQDDLFGHVNGAWLSTYEIPADRARDGSFRTLADQAEVDVRTIIEDAATWDSDDPDAPVAAKIAALYASFMDHERINSVGFEPIRGEIAAITKAKSREELTTVLGRLERVGVSGLFAAFVDNDADDPTSYKLYLMQDGLGLPDEAYYREDGFAAVREAYVSYLAEIFALAHVGNDDAAASVLEFESQLALHHWDNVKDREATLTYNPMSFAEVEELTPQFDWQVWAQAGRIPRIALDELVLREPSFFSGMAALWANTDLETLKHWLLARLLSDRAPYLHDEVLLARFNFFGRALTGAPQLRDRWKRGVAFVESVIGEGVGKLYVARHFPPTHKAAMDQLVADLIEAYRESITNLGWMSPETRQKALIKLDSFTPKIGYPTKWRDYSNLEVTDDLVANVRSSAAFHADVELEKLGRPVDRDEWFMPPQMVNAYYNPGMNEIVFPAAILQPPFFDPNTDEATNYAGIGAVIGHEIGHGFDDQGSHYDGTGRLSNWWTDADREAFDVRVGALIEQYNALSPRELDGSHSVNGALTVGENIGDLGGLSIALKAYRIALKRAGKDTADEVDGVSGLERFFFSWARIWRTKARQEEAVRLLTIDPHSPAEFRANQVVRNIEEFYKAFEVTESDALWLDPEHRVSIW